ncbi:uncharacterized protein EI90DRAFT_3069354 [Cantharellus anzutake]|uniref:uncharacterized protein n=1 Tax=Cantharellus anzutake TaxID=1750568 RepID=UPI00190822E2|nr:uncharacterized protein EI90DRAFT_3069354 [Cantharellus anzutake]KAF8326867.1 hypothetical protein EI90DRAFT_3069354 [Cantharellus anzutake]
MYTHFGVGAAFVAIISTLSLWILQDHKPLQASARSLVLWIANLISTLVAMVQYERLLHHISSSLCASRSYPAISMGSPLDTAGFVWGWRVFSRVLVGEFTSHDLFRDFVVISLVFGALVAVSFAIVLHPQATWVGRVTTVPFLVCCFALLFVVEAVVLPSVLCWPAALISGSPWFPESGISWRDWDQLAAMIGFILSKLFELLPPVFARLGLTWEVCLFKWLRPYAPSWLRQRLPQAPDSSISEMVADGGEPDGIIHSSRLTSNVGMHMDGTPAGALHQRATSEIVQNTDTCNRSSDAPTPENGSTIAASSDPGPSTIRKRAARDDTEASPPLSTQSPPSEFKRPEAALLPDEVVDLMGYPGTALMLGQTCVFLRVQ